MKEFNFAVTFGDSEKTKKCPFRNRDLCNVKMLRKVQPYTCYGTRSHHCECHGGGVLVSARVEQLCEK